MGSGGKALKASIYVPVHAEQTQVYPQGLLSILNIACLRNDQKGAPVIFKPRCLYGLKYFSRLPIWGEKHVFDEIWSLFDDISHSCLTSMWTGLHLSKSDPLLQT